jgi:hypothetical protein
MGKLDAVSKSQPISRICRSACAMADFSETK